MIRGQDNGDGKERLETAEIAAEYELGANNMEIYIQNLIKRYGSQTVLNIENLTLSGGAITAVIGPNGAGKSTLLKLIADLIERDSGEISYGAGGSVPPLKEMTLVFQDTYLMQKSIRENIAYPLKIRKVPRQEAEARVQELAEELKLTPILDKRAGATSQGEAQKAALARALSFRPRLLLLDEPCASIDLSATMEIERLLKKINREAGTTIVIVTHNLAQARRLADYVVMLHHGRVLEQGENPGFFDYPKMPETRRLIEGETLKADGTF